MELSVLAAAMVCTELVWQPAGIGGGAHGNNRRANAAPMSATSTADGAVRRLYSVCLEIVLTFISKT